MPACVSNKFLEEVVQSYPDKWQGDIAKDLLQARRQLSRINRTKISPSTRPRSRRREEVRQKEDANG